VSCGDDLDGGRELDRLGRLHQPMLSTLPRQHVRFHQRPAGMAPARSNGEEAAEFRDDMLAFWTATLHGQGASRVIDVAGTRPASRRRCAVPT
jgi:hypothetical protein